MGKLVQTFLNIDTNHSYNFHSVYFKAHGFTANSASAYLREQDEALQVTVFEQLRISTHVPDICNFDDYQLLRRRILAFVKPAFCGIILLIFTSLQKSVKEESRDEIEEKRT